MTVQKYMEMLQEMEFGEYECVTVVTVKGDGHVDERIAICSSDNLPTGTTIVKMESIANAVVHILETRVGVS